ncbi:NUDIX domain-containing protein [Candidatus Parcubacteria bacterium]|nr:NUDIX domain-containing protein [Patescibacteria group bacterium]MCG2689517.1 NUDIX domain-containing protein [Candidatus Parcubacteria bacterium]
MPGKTIPYDRWLEVMEVVPWPVVDLLVVSGERIWLIKREISGKDQSYAGMWHLPGGFLLKNETFEECVRRISVKELRWDISGIPVTFSGLVLNNPHEVRGHLVHIPMVLDLSTIPLTETENAHLFPITALPAPMISHHITIIEQCLKSVVRGRSVEM